MTLFNQFTISISLIIIAISLIVGIILISINIFRVNNSIKQQNNLIQLIQRPYLNVTYSNNNILIKNTGKSSAIIDSILFNDEEFNGLVNTKINPKQVRHVPVELINTVSVKYHNNIDDYQDTFTL